MWTTTPSWTARGWPSAAAVAHVAHVVTSARSAAESQSADRMMTHDPSRARSRQCPEFDTRSLGAREAGPAQAPDAGEANVVRVREPLAGEQGDEPREDGVRRPAVELLVGDRANERLVERSATEGRQGAGAGFADQLAHDRVGLRPVEQGRLHHRG